MGGVLVFGPLHFAHERRESCGVQKVYAAVQVSPPVYVRLAESSSSWRQR